MTDKVKTVEQLLSTEVFCTWVL